MRLHEIHPSIIKNFYKQDVFADEIEAKLENSGFIKIGRGYHAVVYEKDNVIAKFSKPGDPCYLKYVEYIRTHKNPHYPHVSKPLKISREDIRSINSPSFLVFIEKLQPLPHSAKLIDNLGKLYRILIDPKDRQVFSIDRVYNNLLELGYDQYEIKRFVKNNYSFFVAFQQIRRYFKKTNCFFDIKWDNIMYRSSTGHMVITDPVAGSI